MKTYYIIPFAMLFMVVAFGVAFCYFVIAQALGMDDKIADGSSMFIMGVVWWHLTSTTYQELSKL